MTPIWPSKKLVALGFTSDGYLGAEEALIDLFRSWGLDLARLGALDWNPLGALIPPGSRVLIKPNLVMHRNESGAGLDCLITHPALIRAVLKYVLRTRPQSIVLGDAPVQGCDFETLRASWEIDSILAAFQRTGHAVILKDFRRTVLHQKHGRKENQHDPTDYVLFDLGSESLLEPLTSSGSFRVTMYSPADLARSHSPGIHRYLIAKDAIEANVIVNLPKLKCHKKAGITGALKNLVGINGNKEFLPHHRSGGSESNGDCYQRASPFKAFAERLYDIVNRTESPALRSVLALTAATYARAACLLANDDNLDGSWPGNDTVWRMVLDVQRIAHYGTLRGHLAPTRQRNVITITDAIVAGEGDGPLAPTPVRAGFLSGAVNPAAADWINARLMGFNPERIPIVRGAFDHFRFALAEFSPNEILVRCPTGDLGSSEVAPMNWEPFKPPKHWAGHCELKPHSLVCHA